MNEQKWTLSIFKSKDIWYNKWRIGEDAMKEYERDIGIQYNRPNYEQFAKWLYSKR